MNIGIDIDDTITCTYETLLPIIALKYGINVDNLFNRKLSYRSIYNIFPNYSDFVKNNYTTMAKIVPLKEGVIEVLNKLKEEGHKIIFISARNNLEYNDPYQLSYDYLKFHNVPFDKLIVNVQDKAKECIVEQIDLFIDDSTKNCKAVKNKGVKTLQFATLFTPENKYLNRVSSWNEVYKKVVEMYS